jgi:hypothetical protein
LNKIGKYMVIILVADRRNWSPPVPAMAGPRASAGGNPLHIPSSHTNASVATTNATRARPVRITIETMKPFIALSPAGKACNSIAYFITGAPELQLLSTCRCHYTNQYNTIQTLPLDACPVIRPHLAVTFLTPCEARSITL